MNFKDWRKSMKSLEKFFVSYDGEVLSTDGLHEELARKICKEKDWDWRQAGFFSCEDFLLM